MSEKAFVFASNTAFVTVSQGADVPFNAIGPEEKLTPPALGGTAFVIKHHGKYLYSFQVDGTPDVPAAANVFGLTKNGSLVANTLSSNEGTGIVYFSKDDIVTLRLTTNSPGGNVSLNSTALNGANNASLTLVLIDD